jgi:hypothetical protein
MMDATGGNGLVLGLRADVPRQDGSEDRQGHAISRSREQEGFPVGTLNLEIDKDDNPWVGVMYQSAVAADKKTETSSCPTSEWIPTPAPASLRHGNAGRQQGGSPPMHNIYRLDLVSDKFEVSALSRIP